jgi:hypothetical protein
MACERWICGQPGKIEEPTKMMRIGAVALLLLQLVVGNALAHGNCTPKLGHPPLARKGVLIAAINPTVAPIQYINDDGDRGAEKEHRSDLWTRVFFRQKVRR